MAQKLSFAGITLPLATPELEEGWLSRVNPLDTLKFFDSWNFDSMPDGNNAIPTPSLPVPPKFRIGVLHWPTGACRPAWFHAVVNTDRLNSIRNALSDPMQPRSLILNDGRDGKTITASMYMLPAVPLNQLGHTSSDLWLLTLTDQRFFWYFKRGVIEAPVSWTHLYSQISTILGVTITPDTVNSAYMQPSSKWAQYYGPTSAILDAVASQVGQKVIVSLSGVVSTVNATTAQQANLAYTTDADTVLSGGTIAQTDIAKYVPASVRVLFIDTSESPPAAAPHVETETLAALTITGYGSSTGLSGFTQTLFADIPYDGDNTANVEAYSEQAARDWYTWRLADTDVVWPLIEPYVPTGWEDHIEWTFQKRGDGPFASTTVRQGPYSSIPSGNWYAGQTPSNPVEPADCAPGCDWIAGMLPTWCMNASAIGAWGQCSGIDTTQTFHLRHDGTQTWISQEWSSVASAWVNKDFIYDTGSGPLKVWLDKTTTDRTGIAASIDDINIVLRCCTENAAVFSAGTNVATGFCTGGEPNPCDLNVFRVRVECGCCVLDGYTIPAWYCIVDAQGDCEGEETVCAFLDQADGSACDTDIEICAGPFSTREECLAACGASPVSPLLCSDPVPATLNWAITNKTGLCSCAPDSGTVTYDAGDEVWGSADFDCLINECEENASYWIGCVDDVWYYKNSPTGISSGTVATSAVIDGSGDVTIVFNITAVGGTYTITFTTPP